MRVQENVGNVIIQKCQRAKGNNTFKRPLTLLHSCILILFLLSGCYDAPDKLKPMPWIFGQMPKDAPNNYKRGWKDGCESGLGNMTNAMYKTFYTFKQDKKLREDATYYSTWKTSYNFCRHYAYGTIRQSDQRMVLPNKRSEFHEAFLGADGGILGNSSALNLFGPGGDTLLSFQKVGHIGGDPWITALGYGDSAGGNDPNSSLGGNGALIDFSDGYDLPSGVGAEFPGMSWDYSNVPFFGATDAWGNK